MLACWNTITAMTKEEILETKTMLEVVNSYGLPVNRSGFIRCPFHTGDNHASLKIYRKSFYCFGCGKGGDVFTFVQLYEQCDFHTAFLRLGGTDRRKGERVKRKDLMDAYRAKQAADARKRQVEKKKRRLLEIGEQIDHWRELMKAAEPLTDEWAEAYNHWLIACQEQIELMETDKKGGGENN